MTPSPTTQSPVTPGTGTVDSEQAGLYDTDGKVFGERVFLIYNLAVYQVIKICNTSHIWHRGRPVKSGLWIFTARGRLQIMNY
ncbi:hypothetical protein BS78_K330400 [Paspalum vaginatum]|uniref:Uncharacterized protein n=1 Tax=Paspalum vaginatum TaxID=158149 RepID=A0A9W7XDS7_9POAL|nr:hypothetical protein BS78_K330400 [Paspalum vaginatum]